LTEQVKWELILGALGSVTGTISTILHIWNHFQNKPKLSIDINQAHKTFQEQNDTYGAKHTAISLDFDVMNRGNMMSSIRKASLEVDVEKETITFLPAQQHQAGLMGFQPKFSIMPGETQNQSLTFYNFEHVVREKVHGKLVLVDIKNKKIAKQFMC